MKKKIQILVPIVGMFLFFTLFKPAADFILVDVLGLKDPTSKYEAERIIAMTSNTQKSLEDSLSKTSSSDRVSSYINGLLMDKFNEKNDFVDSVDKSVSSGQWDDVSSFREGLARVKKDGKYGFIDTTGTLVIPCQWDYAAHFSGGVALVKKDGKSGRIDTNGNIVSDLQ